MPEPGTVVSTRETGRRGPTLTADALGCYELALRSGGALALHAEDGSRVADLELQRWTSPASGDDIAALAQLDPPVIDIGCGPGRIVEALTSTDTSSLGIDISPAAIGLARARGLNALVRDVFGPLPLEGQWASAVLLDGNIGIGGDPLRLLLRVASIVRPGGRVVVETDPDHDADRAQSVRFWLDGRPASAPFRWAFVGRHPLATHARLTGFDVSEVWQRGGRTFGSLVRRSA